MKLTPIDIQQYKFRRSLRGLDPREVRTFLDSIAQQLGDVSLENSELRADQRRTRRELDEHKERETSLREAMLTAQRAIDEIREQAQKEAQLVVADAEIRAEKIVHAAHSRVTKIQDDIRKLRELRVRAIEELRGVLRTHERLLDVHDETDDLVEEGELKVLQRLRAPSPPSTEELERASG